MTREEVMALTDAELQEKAAELYPPMQRGLHIGQHSLAFSSGKTKIELMAFPEFVEREWDPVHDIAAAWELVVFLEKRGYETILVNCAGTNLKAVRIVKALACAFPPEETLDNPRGFSIDRSLANVQAESMKSAITRAFVLAMTRGAK